MINFLAKIEEKIQALLEDGLDRLLHPGASYSLSAELLNLIKENIRQEKPKSSGESHQKFAPDHIKLYVPFERYDAWQNLRPVLNEVAAEIEQSFTDEGYKFERKPRIQIIASEDLPLDQIDITTSYYHEIEQTGKTSLIQLDNTPRNIPLPSGACFIVNGKENIPLQKPIVHIGRHSNNDIVIQDPMVSREHLQLRAQRGYYLLFDLSSTGGTTINGQSVHTATLKPGDVVRIGQTVLIYNQDLPETTTKTIVSVPEE
ncbi:MAG TPA: FHA domain-containing protein [Anaerolineaceae bacterium]|jgi:pSer/pThr/pTyr-binding forkhead associated (FHA) protein|nr:FHA domain-containing protein [Anaerolineaceae bacterium]